MGMEIPINPQPRSSGASPFEFARMVGSQASALVLGNTTRDQQSQLIETIVLAAQPLIDEGLIDERHINTFRTCVANQYSLLSIFSRLCRLEAGVLGRLTHLGQFPDKERERMRNLLAGSLRPTRDDILAGHRFIHKVCLQTYLNASQENQRGHLPESLGISFLTHLSIDLEKTASILNASLGTRQISFFLMAALLAYPNPDDICLQIQNLPLTWRRITHIANSLGINKISPYHRTDVPSVEIIMDPGHPLCQAGEATFVVDLCRFAEKVSAIGVEGQDTDFPGLRQGIGLFMPTLQIKSEPLPPTLPQLQDQLRSNEFMINHQVVPLSAEKALELLQWIDLNLPPSMDLIDVLKSLHFSNEPESDENEMGHMLAKFSEGQTRKEKLLSLCTVIHVGQALISATDLLKESNISDKIIYEIIQSIPRVRVAITLTKMYRERLSAPITENTEQEKIFFEKLDEAIRRIEESMRELTKWAEARTSYDRPK